MKLLEGIEKKLKKTDQGFSLVEVIVCIAIIAIISVPVLAGMRTSAKLNSDAHSVQTLTALAQEELEKIKSISVNDYKTYIAGNGGSVNLITDDALYPQIYNNAQTYQASFSDIDSLSAKEKEELFTPFYCEQTGIVVGRDTYTMRTIFEPAPYSRENTSSGDAYAYDINVTGLSSVTEADAARFPVISDEINQYEGGNGSVSAIVADMKSRLEALGNTTITESEIATGMQKLVDITVTTSAASSSVKVECDVTYVYDAVKLYYRVYSGTYPYSPTKAEIDSGAVIGKKPGELSGGDVFIFARAFQDQNFPVNESGHCLNSIRINVSGDGDMPVNVYLVRGYLKDITNTYKTDYNFDEVLINGSDYLGGGLTGKAGLGNGNFYTNIKNASWNRSGIIDNDDLEKVIGKGDYKTRCYQVTIELLDENGETGARISSTKIEK